jgi:hypothetical protein
LSQRTRGPMTGAANHKPSEATDLFDATASASTSRPRRPTQNASVRQVGRPTQDFIGAEAIARMLRVMADELERDPALAQRVASATAQADAPDTGSGSSDSESAGRERTRPPAAPECAPKVGVKPFKARIVTGATPALGPGIPDPFALRARLGRDGLSAALEELRLGTLRAMIREYHLATIGDGPQSNDASRMRLLILAATDHRQPTS